ncbi:MAG: dihydrodipicolinate synthase family protein [Geminicoccaceae bacterium]
MTPSFRGIWPILYAFFGPDGRLDRAAMRLQVEACVAAGVHGIAALGLATEVSKLSPTERRDVMAWVVEDAAGRVPVAITVFGEDVAAQVGFVREAASLGAAWVILQPPPQRPLEEADLLRFFGRVLDASPIPGAIQNAPQYLGVGLGIDSLRSLRRQHPNFVLLKGEAPALDIAATIEALHGEVAVFNGRGGLELPDCLRAGCAGLIPAPECVDVLVAVYETMRRGDEVEAERLYASVLPLMVFVMQSIPQFLCYGKRILAHRLGLGEVHDRQPAMAPTPLGVATMRRYAAILPMLLESAPTVRR